MKYIINDSGARLLVFEQALRDRVTPIKQELEFVEGFIHVGSAPEGDEIGFDDFIAPASDAEPAVGAGLDDPPSSCTPRAPPGCPRAWCAPIGPSCSAP
ncbi:MAG: hypothetical protein WDO24_15015 [Pseudomonadota bacterium]